MQQNMKKLKNDERKMACSRRGMAGVPRYGHEKMAWPSHTPRLPYLPYIYIYIYINKESNRKKGRLMENSQCVWLVWQRII
jgi:hypothetical protein